MPNRVKRSDRSTKLSEVISKLHQANRELERIQYGEEGDKELTPIPKDDLYNIAKTLLFVWNSRRSFLDQSLICDPGWLILLTLKVSELERTNIQVSTLCIDSGSPATTALRWIKLLQERSLIEIEPDAHDGRRKFARLTDEGSELMYRYLQNIRRLPHAKGVIF